MSSTLTVGDLYRGEDQRSAVEDFVTRILKVISFSEFGEVGSAIAIWIRRRWGFCLFSYSAVGVISGGTGCEYHSFLFPWSAFLDFGSRTCLSCSSNSSNMS